MNWPSFCNPVGSQGQLLAVFVRLLSLVFEGILESEGKGWKCSSTGSFTDWWRWGLAALPRADGWLGGWCLALYWHSGRPMALWSKSMFRLVELERLLLKWLALHLLAPTACHPHLYEQDSGPSSSHPWHFAKASCGGGVGGVSIMEFITVWALNLLAQTVPVGERKNRPVKITHAALMCSFSQPYFTMW